MSNLSDEDEEYEESKGNRLFGFMFGNVDNSGDLEADYLDKDAKEHLSALADKLGQSLPDIDLLGKSPHTPADGAERDYDEKAENAVNYEDIDEEYDGPEIHAASEEDYLLPKGDYFSSEVSQDALKHTSVFDDENYDEDEDEECEEDNEVERETETQEVAPVVSQGVTSHVYDRQPSRLEPKQLEVAEEIQEEVNELLGSPPNDTTPTLPILYTDGGMVILRFSEIFGIQEPLKIERKRDHRYFKYKERYKSTDVKGLVEEDEEAFLKSYDEGFRFVKQDGIAQQKYSSLNNDINIGVRDASSMPVDLSEPIEDPFISGKPLKNDMIDDVSVGWSSHVSANVFPLDQQDWEQNILWDTSPAKSDNSRDSSEPFGHDSEGLAVKGSDAESRQESLQETSGELNQTIFVHGSPVLLESFGSRDPSLPTGGPICGNRLHPQLLRLEFQSEAVDPNQGNVAENLLEPNQSDALRRFSKLTLENRDSMEDSWSNNIIWDTDTPISRPKLILDLQDEHMLFEILDQDSKDLQLHAGAMIISRSLKPNTGGSFEMQNRKSRCSWQFNIANDKFYMNGKSSQQLQANSNKRNVHSFRIHHSIPALKLQTMKLKLSNKDIANFHRPKGLWYPHDNEVAVKEQGKLPTKGPMKVIIKSLGGKGRTLHVNSEESVSSVKAKASRKLDFKPTEMVKLFYLGKELEDNKSLAAQTVEPNSLVHLVRTKLHLCPCARKLPGENKALRPPGAFKKKSELSVKDGHVVLVEYCEERPLLLSNAGMGANLCTYYQKSSPGDQRNNMESNENKSWGSTLILEPGDKSPFLGDIRAGCSQSSLETNMYKAPIFPHKVQSTDYLLVRSTKGKLSIRRIDRVAAVGQQEPLMEIMTPGSKNLQTYMVNRMLVYVYREFVRSGLRRPIAADELSFLFSNLSEAIIKKNLRACAFPRRDKNGQLCWFMRHDFHSPPENELRKMVAPEHVCSYESMQAGLYRLKHLGITRLTLPASISSAMTQLPNVAIDLAAASHIERALQITPWNLSNNFVACTNQDRVNIERLEITGVGDPSGRGLGFSYVRAVPKAPMSGGQTKKKVAAARGASTVTGTDADLRRLSMEAAREVLLKFNVPEEQIAKQTRWHRIANIRQLSSDQAASGVKVDPTTISKYARGQRMSFLQLQQQTREKCQEIWDRQVQSLSAFDCDENDSESEANSDLDSFAGDLENLLYAEEEEGDEGDNLCQNEILDGVKGIKMRRRPSQVPVEEEFEDEAAEATELCRLLMDDVDEQKKKKKKKVTPMIREEGFVPGPRSIGTVKIAEHVKKLTPGTKKTINISQPDWSGAKNEKISRDAINVQNLSIKRNISGKEKSNKENGTLSVGQPKKVIILGDQLLMYKEKKSARERFVCGACGQFGHMRTNKNCPKYGEPIETQLETTEIEKSAGKYNTLDQPGLSQTKLMKKKAVPKSATKITVVEAHEGETSSSKTKVLPLKFRYGHGDKLSSEATGSSNQAAMTDLEPRANSVVKISKIKISNKVKPEVQVESDKVTLTKGLPEYTDRGQSENYNMPSASLQLPLSTKKEQVGTYKQTVAIPATTNTDHKPHIVILPPTEKERDQPQKKIIIKRSKEKTDQDQISLDGSPLFEHRKTKRMADLAGLQRNRKQESFRFIEESSEQRVSEDKSWWEEEETRRNTERHREERVMNSYRGQSRGLEEVERFDELKRYEEAIRREREEEELRKATKKKKKKKKQPEIMDDYTDGYHTRRNDRRIPERDRSAKRRAVAELGRFGAEYAPPTKRRRGGEVGLSNILEGIVETLRENTEVSFLFLKPVSKKEAPDYLNIIEDPMDLSTIRDKARRMEYKGREDFRHDVWLITYNAHKYNDGRNPQIPPLADQLLELCDYLLELNCESLREAEASIRSKDH